MPQPYTSPDAKERAKRVELILFDVDGVLTDGQILIIPGSNGAVHEYKTFNVQDGVGLTFARRVGLRLGILTGRTSESVSVRAKELGMEIIEQGSLNKLDTYQKIREQVNLADAQIAFMGDDLQDLPCLRRAGLAIGPANSQQDIRQYCHLITEHTGGHGAVRDALEFIIRAQGKWDQIMARYLA
ncbi:MAG: HAD hydrolase family protein [Acidobacteria bacterium]|nr:HAD hydrolase family protein [Acidobacteriota bacterium]